MNKKNWTDGPWHWEMVDPTVMALYGPRGDYDFVLWSSICEACAERGNCCTAPRKENADLIAAAPELYDALEELLDHATEFFEEGECDEFFDVLAKARGEGD